MRYSETAPSRPRMKQMIKHEFQRKLSEMAFQARTAETGAECRFWACTSFYLTIRGAV